MFDLKKMNLIFAFEQLQCCGVEEYSDWLNKTREDDFHTVPKSCCIKFGCNNSDTRAIFQTVVALIIKKIAL